MTPNTDPPVAVNVCAVSFMSLAIVCRMLNSADGVRTRLTDARGFSRSGAH